MYPFDNPRRDQCKEGRIREKEKEWNNVLYKDMGFVRWCQDKLRVNIIEEIF